MDNEPTPGPKNHQIVREMISKNFSTQKPKAEIIMGAIQMIYGGEIIHPFLNMSEEFYNQDKVNEKISSVSCTKH